MSFYYLTHPLASMHRLFRINGKLGTILDSNFGLYSGKTTILITASIFAIPFAQGLLYQKLNFGDLLQLPLTAIENHISNDFTFKVMQFLAINVFLNLLRSIEDKLRIKLGKRIENAILREFIELQFSNNGLTNVYICDDHKTKDQLKDLYNRSAYQFASNYINVYFNTVSNVTMIIQRSYIIYNAFKLLQTNTSGTTTNAKLSIIIAISASILADYIGKKLTDRNSKAEALINDHNIVKLNKADYLFDSNKSKTIIANNEIESRFNEYRNLLFNHEFYNSFNRSWLTGLVLNGVSELRGTVTFLTIGSFIINQKGTMTQFNEIRDGISDCLMPFYTFLNIHSNLIDLENSKKTLTTIFKKLEAMKVLASTQYAKITISEDAEISIQELFINVGQHSQEERNGEGSSSSGTEPALVVKVGKLEVKPGEIVALVGGNGCGKTSFFKALAYGIGIDKSDNLQIGAVYLTNSKQDLDNNLSLYENLTEAGLRETVTKEVVKQQLTDLGLLDKFCTLIDNDKCPEGSSDGELKRLTLIRAINSSAKVILLDEQFSGLDSNSRIQTEKFIRNQCANKDRAFLIIDHGENTASREVYDNVDSFNFYDRVYEITKQSDFKSMINQRDSSIGMGF